MPYHRPAQKTTQRWKAIRKIKEYLAYTGSTQGIRWSVTHQRVEVTCCGFPAPDYDPRPGLGRSTVGHRGQFLSDAERDRAYRQKRKLSNCPFKMTMTRRVGRAEGTDETDEEEEAYDDMTSHWNVLHATFHSEECEISSHTEPNAKTCAYTLKELGRLFVGAAKDHETPSVKRCTEEIAAVCSIVPTKRQVEKCRQFAIREARSSAALDMATFEEEAALWREAGNHVEIRTVDALGMYQIKVVQFRSIHGHLKRDGKLPRASVFDPDCVTYDDIIVGQIYLTGWTFVPKTAKDMFPWLRKTFSGDGSHVKVWDLPSGTKTNIVGYDAAYGSVTLLSDYNIFPEGSYTWNSALGTVVKQIPGFNHLENSLISDGEKAAKTSCARMAPLVNHFLDIVHLKDRVALSVGRSLKHTTKKLFTAAVCAQSKDDCTVALGNLAEYAPHAIAYLEKYELSEYTLPHSKLNDKRVSSQLSESSMAADLKNNARHTLPYLMFTNTTKAIEKQHAKNATFAAGLTYPTPPKVETELHWIYERSRQYYCRLAPPACRPTSSSSPEWLPRIVYVRRHDGEGGERRVTFDQPNFHPPSCCEKCRPPLNQGYPCDWASAAIIALHGPMALLTYIGKQHLTTTLKAGYAAAKWESPDAVKMAKLRIVAKRKVANGEPFIHLASHYPSQRGATGLNCARRMRDQVEEQYATVREGDCRTCGRKHRTNECPYGSVGRDIVTFVAANGGDPTLPDDDDRFAPPSTRPEPAEVTRRKLVPQCAVDRGGGAPARQPAAASAPPQPTPPPPPPAPPGTRQSQPPTPPTPPTPVRPPFGQPTHHRVVFETRQQAVDSWRSRAPLCCEGSKSTVVRIVSKRTENIGRAFFCCPLGREPGCGFFRFCDDFFAEALPAAPNPYRALGRPPRHPPAPPVRPPPPLPMPRPPAAATNMPPRPPGPQPGAPTPPCGTCGLTHVGVDCPYGRQNSQRRCTPGELLTPAEMVQVRESPLTSNHVQTAPRHVASAQPSRSRLPTTPNHAQRGVGCCHDPADVHVCL